ncbi:MAG: helix-turn-helix domain containing protein [Alphaproteobacteria bacterium]|nr:helix-turn-helix domain containing protein [Alphaproteobacteria bacterium]MCY4319369.1 helix-turn-helix domain containing protein [Alphaproteobacteria bacterium]
MDADTILDTALALAAERGWRQATLSDIAAQTGCGLAEVYRHFPSKGAIARAAVARIDAAVLSEAGADDGDTFRDRLFDLLMRRYDALKPYRTAIEALWRDLRRDSLAGALLAPALIRSMSRMLEAAGAPLRTPFDLLRVKLLVGIHLSVMRVWLQDDSEDLGRTMARLDKALKRWACVLEGRRG